jgi:hypothetical protein
MMRHWLSLLIFLLILTLSLSKTLDYRIKNEETDTTLFYVANSTNYYAWRFYNSTSLKPISLTTNKRVKIEAHAVHLYLSSIEEFGMEDLVFMRNVSDADDWKLTKSSSIYLIRNCNLNKYLCVALNETLSNFEDKATEPRCHWKIQDVRLEERIVALVVFLTFGIVLITIAVVFGLYYILRRYSSRKEYQEIIEESNHANSTSRIRSRGSITY